MFLRRATAPASRREPALGTRRAARVARRVAWPMEAAAPLRASVPWLVSVALPASVVLLAGCGAPNPRILEATEEARGMPSAELGAAMTEHDKIQSLLTTVRNSKHVFVRDGIERDGPATAAKLQLLLERDPTGVRSAREFIDRIAAPGRADQATNSDRVVLAKAEGAVKEASVPARHWYLVRLAELEGRPPPPTPPEEQRKAEDHARRLLILDALAIIERSDLVFVAPPRPGPIKPAGASSGPKRKPKRKEYTGVQFADMLRKKWEFLGADIEDLDTFIDEIASDSFASMVRYRVVLDDGREEDVGVWLRAQLGAEKAKLAQGGAP